MDVIIQKKLKITVAIIIFILLAIVTVVLGRWVISLRDPVKLADFQGLVATLGAGGWLLLFAIQYIQIVIAFIPGGPIQIVAGALFGPWGGFAICLSGTLIAVATIFYLVSRFGRRVISLFANERDIRRYDFLADEKRLETLVLVLFFIPGTPKDALTYVFALTRIKMSRFMFVSTIARTPAILTSLIAGDSIVDGHWQRALIMFIIMTIIAACGFVLQGFIKKRFNL